MWQRCSMFLEYITHCSMWCVNKLQICVKMWFLLLWNNKMDRNFLIWRVWFLFFYLNMSFNLPGWWPSSSLSPQLPSSNAGTCVNICWGFVSWNYCVEFSCSAFCVCFRCFFCVLFFLFQSSCFVFAFCCKGIVLRKCHSFKIFTVFLLYSSREDPLGSGPRVDPWGISSSTSLNFASA